MRKIGPKVGLSSEKSLNENYPNIASIRKYNAVSIYLNLSKLKVKNYKPSCSV